MKVIDIHIHPVGPASNPNSLLQAMDKAGVEKAVVLALDIGPPVMYNGVLEQRVRDTFRKTSLTNIDYLVKSAKEFLEYANTPNRVVKKFVSSEKHRFIGFGSVSPNRSKEVVTRFVDNIVEWGFKGIKVIPTLQQFDPLKNENARLIWKKAEDHNLIILAHTGFDPGPWEYLPMSIVAMPDRYKNLIESFETKVILAHAGSYSAYHPGLWHQNSVELANKFEHVYLDISAVFYLVRRDKYVNLWREYGIMDKIIFGSDYPAVESLTLEKAVEEVKLSPILDEKEKRMILSLNARSLLGI